MSGWPRRADELLLDVGSIMALLFGGLALLLGSITLISAVLGHTSRLLFAALILSILLAINGFGLIYLSTHA